MGTEGPAPSSPADPFSALPGYTYVPTAGIQVEQPTMSLADRTAALKRIQAYFAPVSTRKPRQQRTGRERRSTNPSRRCKNHPHVGLTTKDPNTSGSGKADPGAKKDPKDLPDGYEDVPTKRAYALNVKLRQHAIADGSYMLQVLHSADNNTFTLVGSAGVFARGKGDDGSPEKGDDAPPDGGDDDGDDDDPKDGNGMIIRALIPLPADIIGAITSGTDLSPITGNITRIADRVGAQLTAKLVRPDGNAIAAPADAGDGAISHGARKKGKVNRAAKFDDKKKPKVRGPSPSCQGHIAEISRSSISLSPTSRSPSVSRAPMSTTTGARLHTSSARTESADVASTRTGSRSRRS